MSRFQKKKRSSNWRDFEDPQPAMDESDSRHHQHSANVIAEPYWVPTYRLRLATIAPSPAKTSSALPGSGTVMGAPVFS